jgi:hypothetical protein
MANFRGLPYLVFHTDRSIAAVVIVCLLATAALMIAMQPWKRLRSASRTVSTTDGRAAFDLAFASSVLFSLSVSYHLNPHDLSLLLLPVSLVLHHEFIEKRASIGQHKWAVIALLAILFLPPIHVWALRAHVYAVVAIPIVLLFVSTAFSGETQLPSQNLSNR